MTCTYDFWWRHIYVHMTIASGKIYWVLRVHIFISRITSPNSFFSRVRLVSDSALRDLSKDPIKGWGLYKSGLYLKWSSRSVPYHKVHYTCIMTMDLKFLLPLSLPWVPNQEDLEPRLKNLWYPFSLVKDNLFQILTSKLLQSEVNYYWWEIKPGIWITSQGNKSWYRQSWSISNDTRLPLN